MINNQLVTVFSDAVEKSVLAAAGGQVIVGHGGEFPRAAWDTFTYTLQNELGPDWLLVHGQPPKQDVNYSAIYHPNGENESVSAVILLGDLTGIPIYTVRAIGTP